MSEFRQKGHLLVNNIAHELSGLTFNMLCFLFPLYFTFFRFFICFIDEKKELCNIIALDHICNLGEAK